VRENIDLDNDPFSRRPTVPQYGWLSGKKKDENETDSKDAIDKKLLVNGTDRIEYPGEDTVDLSSIDIDVNNPSTRRASRYVDDPLRKYSFIVVRVTVLCLTLFDDSEKIR
jgi:hypothetical protein